MEGKQKRQNIPFFNESYALQIKSKCHEDRSGIREDASVLILDYQLQRVRVLAFTQQTLEHKTIC